MLKGTKISRALKKSWKKRKQAATLAELEAKIIHKSNEYAGKSKIDWNNVGTESKRKNIDTIEEFSNFNLNSNDFTAVKKDALNNLLLTIEYMRDEEIRLKEELAVLKALRTPFNLADTPKSNTAILDEVEFLKKEIVRLKNHLKDANTLSNGIRVNNELMNRTINSALDD